MRRWIIRVSILSAIVSALWAVIPFLRSAESQASRQQEAILGLLGKRKWPEINALIAPDYHDDHGFDREEGLSTAHEVLAGFLLVGFDWTPTASRRDGNKVVLEGVLRMHGSGAIGTSEIINRVNQIAKPWTFTWRKDGWKPGDWHLISVSQPEL